jgi:hypothetical protein
MKRLIIMSLFAVGLLLAGRQEASAWSKFKFGIGFNISWEGANNSFLFGLFKGGPAPNNYDGGYTTDGGFPQGAPAPYSPGMSSDGFGAPPLAAPSPTFGHPSVAQPVSYSAYPQGAYQQGGYPQAGGYPQQGGYQTPNYSQGNYQVPSYWYGR